MITGLGNIAAATARPSKIQAGKPKNLLMMPARLALALQADGWWLRSDIIWAKPNPMPESVTDRPTSAHEHVFLLTKRSRYFYDADAVREENSNPTLSECAKDWRERPNNGEWPSGSGGRMGSVQSGRNLRNVWTIATAPFPAAHFATFAPGLAERCIRAGTSERGCCAQCGKPWARVTESDRRPGSSPQRNDGFSLRANGNRDRFDAQDTRWHTVTTTTGWAPGCQCNAEVAPCVVLDPFSGAGTALLVADRLGRDAIGIDLSHAYVEMARERLHADCPLFADINDAPVPEPPEDERMDDLFAEAAE